MKRILITGGAGYIGSVLTEELLAIGHDVCVVDDFRYSENSLNHLLHNSQLKIIKSDVRELKRYREAIEAAEVIIPLAAIVGAPAVSANSNSSTEINVKAIYSLFDLSRDDQLFIMPTTNSAYGKGNEFGFCNEDSPLKPISQYAVDKVEVEKALLNQTSGVSLRLATVFGVSPRMRTDLLVNDFVLRAHRDGVITLFEAHFRRNYIHVRDVARAVNLMLSSVPEVVGQVFNVGLTEANMTKGELCLAIKNQIPQLEIVEVPYAKDPDQRDYLVSNEKIEKLGFKCSYSIDDGITELLKLYAIIKKYPYGNI